MSKRSELPADVRANYPQIDWMAITGMRHRLVHDYLNVDLEKVWLALQGDVPPLIAALSSITPPESPSA